MPILLGTKDASFPASVSYADKRYVRRYTRTYYVQADNSTQDGLTVAETSGLPSIGDAWTSGGDFDTGARLISIDPSPIPGTNLWEVECTWDSTTKQDDEKDLPPDERTPEWDWSYETIQQQLRRDVVDDVPVQNSIGEPLFVDHDVAISILTITRFKESFSQSEIDDYGNRVNDAPFWGFAPGRVKCAGIADRKSDTRGTDGTQYRLVTYVFKVHPDPNGWLTWVLDSGTKYRTSDDANAQILTFVDDNQNPTIGKLDGTGKKLADGADDVNLWFRGNQEADFNDLDLGPW